MIRQYKEQELTQLTRIWIDSRIRECGFISTDLWRNGVDMLKMSIDRSYVYVSVDRKTVNGFIQLDGQEIVGLYAVPDRHFRKVIIQLLSYAKEHSSELTLHAYIKDEDTIKIYNHCGFTVEGHVSNKLTNEPELLLVWKDK